MHFKEIKERSKYLSFKTRKREHQRRQCNMELELEIGQGDGYILTKVIWVAGRNYSRMKAMCSFMKRYRMAMPKDKMR